MSVNNPLFKHAERPAYELPHLMVKLGEHSFGEPLTQEHRHIAQAADSHAFNYLEAILGGIQSIGHFIAAAALNGAETQQDDLAKIGTLIAHLGVQAEYLLDTGANIEATVSAGADVKHRAAITEQSGPLTALECGLVEKFRSIDDEMKPAICSTLEKWAESFPTKPATGDHQ